MLHIITATARYKADSAMPPQSLSRTHRQQLLILKIRMTTMRSYSVGETAWTRSSAARGQNSTLRKIATIDNEPMYMRSGDKMEVNVGVIISNIHDDTGNNFITKLDSIYGEDDIDSVFMSYLTSGCIINYTHVEEAPTSTPSLRPLLASDLLLIPFYCSSYESFLGAERSMQWAQSVRPHIKTVFIGLDKASAQASDLVYLDIMSSEKGFVLELIDNPDFEEQITGRIKHELDIKVNSESSHNNSIKAECQHSKRRKSSRLKQLRSMFSRKSKSTGTQITGG